MASVRAQILAAVMAKLEEVRAALGWESLIRNPRNPIGEDQANAIVLVDGGDRPPNGLTGEVEEGWLEFSVGWLVLESGSDTAEDILDLGFVAISDKLLDPDDIQLGGLAVDIRREGLSDPQIGRSPEGARIVGGQAMDFVVQYQSREGDASTPGP